MTDPVVLLVHGSRTSSVMWRAQTEQLDRAGIGWIAPDLPGHGPRSGERFTRARSLEILDEAVTTTSAPIVVAGLSLGGYLAIHWAAHSDRRPAGVLAAGCSTRPRGIGLAGYRLLARAIGRLPDAGQRLNDALGRLMLPAESAASLLGEAVALGVMEDILAELTGLEMEADLRSLSEVPVRLVSGRWDHFRGDEEVLLRACGNGRIVIVPHAHHLVPFVQPVAFGRVLLELLDEVALAT